MMDIKNNNKYKIDDESLIRIRDSFLSASLNENETLEVIKKIYENQKIILDPHSAVGYGALEKLKIQKDAVVLATAHPCKFPEAILKAIDKNVNLPNNLKNILEEKENFSIIENNIDKVKAHIAASLAS